MKAGLVCAWGAPLDEALATELTCPPPGSVVVSIHHDKPMVIGPSDPYSAIPLLMLLLPARETSAELTPNSRIIFSDIADVVAEG